MVYLCSYECGIRPNGIPKQKWAAIISRRNLWVYVDKVNEYLEQYFANN